MAESRLWERISVASNGLNSFASGTVVVVFIVALLNGLGWSLLVPPFQVPDETAHFAYVQRLAETGRPAGAPGRAEGSSEQFQVIKAMGTLDVIGRSQVKVPYGQRPDALISRSQGARRDNGGGPSSASTQPPLYYALSAVVYRGFTWTTLPTRLHAIRALSALIFAIGAALCTVFVREVLPRHPRAALVGGLAVALSPYTAFISSGVTPDTLLLAVSAALMVLIAKSFRHGVTKSNALLYGLILGCGAITKLTFLAFVPPAVLILIALIARDQRRRSTSNVRLSPGVMIATIALAVGPPAIAAVWAVLTRSPGEATSVLSTDVATGGSIKYGIVAVYAWELFLPRLPFMSSQFDYVPLTSTWIDGFGGRFGWLDYSAPGPVLRCFETLVGVLVVLVIAGLVRARHSLKGYAWQIFAYLGMFVALAVVLAKTGYDYRSKTNYEFEQPRYLFGFAAQAAAFCGIAVIGAGRRLSPLVGVALVGAFCLHDLSGIVETLLRYYG